MEVIDADKQNGVVVLPPEHEVFAAFNFTPFDQVKVVILGQDPYHGLNQAHGLAFSVRHGVPPPPSLKNIFAELASDPDVSPPFKIPSHGNLEPWAKQGVLLLNAVLTVQLGMANSHANKGWERFTDAAIRHLSDQRRGLVFLLWGVYAQKKAALIDTTKHHILTAAHPSPLSAQRFFGCRHFSRANRLLVEQNQTPVDWTLHETTPPR
jgi:uracil-DNA glycosylase